MYRALAIAILLAACGGKSKPTTDGTGTGSAPPPAGACVVGGCSGTICSEPGNDVITTCEYKAEYACYKAAACAKQADGKCGWTQSAELTACLANPPPMAAPPPGGTPQ